MPRQTTTTIVSINVNDGKKGKKSKLELRKLKNKPVKKPQTSSKFGKAEI